MKVLTHLGWSHNRRLYLCPIQLLSHSIRMQGKHNRDAGLMIKKIIIKPLNFNVLQQIMQALFKLGMQPKSQA
jgi:hypothetical protein